MIAPRTVRQQCGPKYMAGKRSIHYITRQLYTRQLTSTEFVHVYEVFRWGGRDFSRFERNLGDSDELIPIYVNQPVQSSIVRLIFTHIAVAGIKKSFTATTYLFDSLRDRIQVFFR